MAKKSYYGEHPEKKEKMSFKKITGLDGWDIFKGSAGLVAGGCASAVVHRYLAAAVPKGTNLPEKIMIAAGVYFVTGFVGHKVEQHIISELDDLKAAMKTVETAAQERSEDVDNG